ncbi:MAG: hypothetical protein P4L33_05405 [Capsulimonadaceae bacterium]|nr:hypothetical protein [Capsulimonadaceae bacterium]
MDDQSSVPDPSTEISRDIAAPNQPNGRALAQRVSEASTMPQKAQLLWGLPTLERHAALGEMPPDEVAAIIESNPEENTALLGNIPAPKFSQIVNLAPPAIGREWLERAVTCGLLSAQMLPALLSARDLMPMLMSAPELRTILPRLLNYQRATDMRTLLHPLEWKTSLDDMLLADAEELLRKAPIKNKALKSILQSLLDFFPELYLETIRLALGAAKYHEDHPDELEDITEAPFALPELLQPLGAEPAANGHQPAETSASTAPTPTVADLVPSAADPFLSMATSKLSDERRAQLERELKELLRTEIVAGGSFSQTEIMRAAGRLLYQLREGLTRSGAPTPEAAAKVLETRSLADVALAGARSAERIRQKSLRLAGYKDWLDRHQKQFLAGIARIEPGLDPQTGEPVLKIASRPNQPPEEWPGFSSAEIEERLEEMITWASLARAAFGTPARVQSIFATAKTRTADEAARRTVIALCLYRRWEPELVRPGEDIIPFRRQFSDSLHRLNMAREIVLQALDATPDDTWKPADAKEKARAYLLRAVDQLERQPTR